MTSDMITRCQRLLVNVFNAPQTNTVNTDRFHGVTETNRKFLLRHIIQLTEMTDDQTL